MSIALIALAAAAASHSVTIDHHGQRIGATYTARARAISTDKRFSGSEPGACHPARQPGETTIARHRDAIQAHLVAVAQADRAPLLAELDSARALASN